ncbi:MAG: Gfo/Idh/MocA family oxidoreductase [Ignavibacteriaceae bacterium]|nr:Gfo/Idh/MocA family oxidoreductase [Ignavibacteriaceae bacterium]
MKKLKREVINLEGIKVGIFGAGRWGMNHVRTANKILGGENVTVCDPSPGIELKIKELNPEINFTVNPDDVFNDSLINCTIIATPVETHFNVAIRALESGKHALVEKPITLHVQEAEKLNSVATDKGLRLMVGHVLLFHPAVIKMKQMINEGDLGVLQYMYSHRLNLGTIRKEENILWSFAPHDISVIQYLADSNPISISAKGADFIRSEIEDVTLTTFTYPNNFHAHIFVSWLHPFKEQRMVIIGTKGMLVFEDSAVNDKLKFFKKGFMEVDGEPEKFDEEAIVVGYENKAPLEEEQRHFFECVLNGNEARTNGVHALEVLKILEEAQHCLKQK